MRRLGLGLLFASLAACAAPPAPSSRKTTTVPLDDALIIFRAKTQSIILKLDDRDSVVITLTGTYKGYKDGTRFRLRATGDGLCLVIEEAP